MLRPSAVAADTFVWNPVATGSSWNDSTNWGLASLPGSADTAQFAADTYTVQPSLDSPAEIGGLWGTGSGAVAIGGNNPLTLYGTINGNPATGIEWDSTAGPLSIDAPLVLANDQTWVNDSPNLLAINGNISGGGLTLSSSGSGTFALNTANTCAGTTLSGGTLQIGNAAALGSSGSLTVNAGLLDVHGYSVSIGPLSGGGTIDNLSSGTAALTVGNGDGSSTFAGTVQDTQGGLALTKVGSGTITLAGFESYRGATLVSGGTLVLSSDGPTSSFTAANGGCLQFNAAAFNLGYRFVRAASGSEVQYENVTLSGGFLRGPGTHSFLAGTANSLNGTMINNGAAVQQGGNDTWTNVSSGGSIHLNANLTWQGGSNSVSGNVIVNGLAAVSQWGNDGVLSVNSGGVLNNLETTLLSDTGSQVYVNSSGTLNADSDGNGEALDMRGSLLVNNGTITGTTIVAGGATAQGLGQFDLLEILPGGTLAISSTAAPAGNGLFIAGGSVAGSGTLSASATVSSALLTAPNAADLLVISGNLSGPGPLATGGLGTVLLSGSNSYTGGTSVSAGRLIVNDGAALAAGSSLLVGAAASQFFAAAAEASSGVATAVPEPGSLLLLICGAVFLAMARALRQNRFWPASFALMLVASPAPAAIWTWNPDGSDPSWSTASNWGGSVPGGADIAQFASNSFYAAQPAVTASATVGGIWVTGAGAIALGGSNSLTLTGTNSISGIPNVGIGLDPASGPLAINVPLILAANQTWYNNSAGTLAVNNQLLGNSLTTTGSGSISFCSAAAVGIPGLTVAGGTVNQNGASVSLSFAEIDGGTYNWNAGAFNANSVYVGYLHSGTFNQLGGNFANNSGTLSLGNSASGSGTYSLGTSSSLTLFSENLGLSGSGTFTQNGGTNRLVGSSSVAYANLTLGANSGGWGTYNLAGGLLDSTSAAQENIGGAGGGTFLQTSGTHNGQAFYINNNGSYFLQGGQLNSAGTVWVNGGQFSQSGGTAAVFEAYILSGSASLSGTGSLASSYDVFYGPFTQSGGTHTVSNAIENYATLALSGSSSLMSAAYLQSAKLLNLSGGSLQINGGLQFTGTLNGLNGKVSISGSNSIFDFSGGTVVNMTAGSLTIGPGSLVIVPSSGFDPGLAFGGNYYASGTILTHTAGTTLKVSATQSFGGIGTINDFVSCSGAIAAGASPGITLQGGLKLSGSGNVNLGPGNLNVSTTSSAQLGGTLSANHLFIGGSVASPSNFSLSAGSAFASSVEVGYRAPGSLSQSGGSLAATEIDVANGSSGTLSLSGSGSVNAQAVYVGFRSGSGSLWQTGGSLTATNVYLAYSGSSGVYYLGGGQLATSSLTSSANSLGLVNFTGGTLSSMNNLPSSIQAPIWLSGSGSLGTVSNSNSSSSMNLSGPIYGPGQLQIAGIGAVTLSGSNTFTGGTLISSGELVLSGSRAAGSGPIQFAGSATLQAGVSATLPNNLAINPGVSATLDTQGNALSIGGVISGAGALTKIGTGRLTFLAANTYTGPTNISAGTLQLSASSSIGPGNAVTVANGAALALTSAANLSADAVTISSGGLLDTSAAGSNFALGAGNLLTIGRSSGSGTDLNGNLTLGGGTLNVGGTGTAATLNVAGNLTLAGGTLLLDLGPGGNDSVNVANLNLNGPATINVNATGGFLGDGAYNLVNFSGSLGGSASALSVTGLTSTGTRQSYSLVTSGSAAAALQLQVSEAPAALVWSGSANGVWDTSSLNWSNSGTADKFYTNDAVAFDDSAATANVVLNGSLQPQSVVFNNAAPNYTLSGSGGIAGTASLTKNGSGTVTLGGSNSYTGGTNVNGGAVIFSSSSAVAGSNGSINVAASATAAAGYPIDQGFVNQLSASSAGVAALAADSANNLSLVGFSALRLGAVGNATYSGTLTPSGTTYRLGGGGGTLTLTLGLTGSNGVDVDTNGTPPGTVVLAGSNTYTGGTQVSGGTLVLLADGPSASFTAAAGGSLQFRSATLNLGSRTITAAAGGNVQYAAAALLGGVLAGSGTHTLLAGTANNLNGTTISNSAIVLQNGTDNLTDVTSNGRIDNYANLTWQSGSLGSSGTLNVNGLTAVSEWFTSGAVNINNGGTLNNSVTDLVSGGGRIGIASGGTLNIDSNGDGVALDLRGGLLVNNGTITGTTNVYYGATATGSGSYGPVQTFPGGTFVISPSASPVVANLIVSGGSISGAGQSDVPATLDTAAIDVPQPGDVLVLSGNLDGSGLITKLGPGTAVLSGENTFHGGIDVAAGRLVLASETALPAGSSLTVGSGASTLFAPAVLPALSPVPEPGAAALVGVGLVCLALFCSARRLASLGVPKPDVPKLSPAFAAARPTGLSTAGTLPTAIARTSPGRPARRRGPPAENPLVDRPAIDNRVNRP
jgi:fibronectin-binding autotransporter adhesin